MDNVEPSCAECGSDDRSYGFPRSLHLSLEQAAQLDAEIGSVAVMQSIADRVPRRVEIYANQLQGDLQQTSSLTNPVSVLESDHYTPSIAEQKVIPLSHSSEDIFLQQDPSVKPREDEIIRPKGFKNGEAKPPETPTAPQSSEIQGGSPGEPDLPDDAKRHDEASDKWPDPSPDGPQIVTPDPDSGKNFDTLFDEATDLPTGPVEVGCPLTQRHRLSIYWQIDHSPSRADTWDDAVKNAQGQIAANKAASTLEKAVKEAGSQVEKYLKDRGWKCASPCLKLRVHVAAYSYELWIWSEVSRVGQVSKPGEPQPKDHFLAQLKELHWLRAVIDVICENKAKSK